MLKPAGSLMADQVVIFLTEHGAGRFATDWLATTIVFKSIGVLPTMIFAPTDGAIDRLVAASNRTWDEILKLPAGIDILENHVSAKPTQKAWPMFVGLNNREFGRDENDITTLRPVASHTFTLFNGKPFVVIVIDDVILHESQLSKLKSSKLGYSTWQRPLVEIDNPLLVESDLRSEIDPTTVGRDIFGLIINQGLVGRDLLALCTGNSRARELCDRDNQAMFKRLLQQEFNFNWERGFARETPRELYAKLHNSRIDVYLQEVGVGEIVGNWVLVEDSRISPAVAKTIKGQIDRGFQSVSIPVDGWFVQNAKTQFEEQTLFKMAPVRETIHLFYVKNRPATATLAKISQRSSSWTTAHEKPVIEMLSNNWFPDYFVGKTIAPVGTFQNLRGFGNTPEGIMQSLIMARAVGIRARVLIDGVEETIMYVQLGNNKLQI